MNYIKRTQNRIKTRAIAVIALITSVITFGSGLFVFLYMKSPAFEIQLLGQVIKHLDWIIEQENKEYIQWKTKDKWKTKN